MNWIDALIEMNKDNSKVFEVGDYKVKIKNGILLQYHKADGWQVRMIGGKEQEVDWIEVPQFKEVDYAEFMEWYCNPNNKGKPYKSKYTKQKTHFESFNYLDHTPGWINAELYEFQIPNQ